MGSRSFQFGICIATVIFTFFDASSQASPMAKLLGFGPHEKILLIHADDLGSVHSANEASFDLMKFGLVHSGSVMMPTPAADEVFEAAEKDRNLDLGIHITLTSEWDDYRWGPVEKHDRVKSIIGGDGFFFQDLFPLFVLGRKGDIAREIRAQVAMAFSKGLHPTHMDTHMGAAFMKESWFDAYLRTAYQHRLPPMYPRWSKYMRDQYGIVGCIMQMSPIPGISNRMEKQGFVPLDYLMVGVDDNLSFLDRKQKYVDLLKSLKPGVTQFIIHPAYADLEFQQKILKANPEQVSRHFDAKIFQDPEIKALIEKLGIHLIGWREIQAVYPWDKVKLPLP